MKILQGKGVSQGIAFGKVKFFRRDEVSVKRGRIEDADAELVRYLNAKRAALSQLDELYTRTLSEAGKQEAEIFSVHRMMIEDPDFNSSVERIIRRQNINAEYAVAMTSRNFAEMFSIIEDDFMRERVADVQDVSNRLVRCLMNKQASQQDNRGKCVICADDFSPSETAQMDRDSVVSLCTSRGSATSHTAILARTLGIPAVVGLRDEFYEICDGDEIIVDGGSGLLYVDPDEETKEKMQRRQAEELLHRRRLNELRGRDNITRDGHRIGLYANIGGLEDIDAAILNDCGGIGLFRSEFLYLDNSEPPSEELQYGIYKQALERMKGKRVIIRTLDIGADKQASCFVLPREENPALGVRGIRFCFANPEVFRTQLRALLRASVHGRLGIMFPMITALEEVQEIKRIISEIKSELDKENIAYSSEMEIGVMIETPAAVMISDLLAQEVDFFSVGSNDLAQYALAADRLNPGLEQYHNARHTAVLRMIKIAADNAHANGSWIGICGEIGADEELTEAFLAMGVDELSVIPTSILPLREKVLSLDLSRKELILDAIGSVTAMN